MKLKANREAYAYPAAALIGTVENHANHLLGSSWELDNYHHDLLRSGQDEHVVMGYLSVLYWGHYATSNGRILSSRALSKVQTAIHGSVFLRKGKPVKRRGLTDITTHEAVRLIREASALVDQKNVADAIRALCDLPQLQFAFASKVVAFMDPASCGVIDSVIAKKHPEYGFNLRSGYVSNVKENFRRYQEYCLELSATAARQNTLGELAQWIDRDGQARPWRAIDIERAMYSQ